MGLGQTEIAPFVIFLFGLIYNIFGIIFLFSIYREIKAQFYENISGAARAGLIDEERNEPVVRNQTQNQNIQRRRRSSSDNNENTNTRPRGFVPFGGTGVALGGS